MNPGILHQLIKQHLTAETLKYDLSDKKYLFIKHCHLAVGTLNAHGENT